MILIMIEDITSFGTFHKAYDCKLTRNGYSYKLESKIQSSSRDMLFSLFVYVVCVSYS